MDTHDAIARRTSTRNFRAEALPRHVIERLLAAAVRAPNHKLTEPWRFVVVTGAAKALYAGIRKAYRARRFDDPATPEAQRAINRTWQDHLDTPAFVFVLCALSEDSIRREEDYGAVMMAIQNLLVAATADGIGSFLSTGGIMEHPEVLALVGAPAGFRLVGIVSLGYLASEVEPTPRKKPLNELIAWKD